MTQTLVHLTELIASRGAVVDSNRGSILDATEKCVEGYLAIGYVAIIRFMLERGADINRQCADGNTPLIDAAIMGETEAVNLLLCHGAVVDLTNKKHQTALHAACFQAHEGAVRLLLAAGASTTLEDSRGCRAMDLATEPAPRRRSPPSNPLHAGQRGRHQREMYARKYPAH